MTAALRALALPLALALVALAACAADPAAPAASADADPDAAPDAPADTAADVPADAPPDAPAADAAPDAPADTAADAPPDAPADAPADAPSDAPADLAPDVPPPPPPLPAAPDHFAQIHLPAVPIDAIGESAQLYPDMPEGTSSVFVQIRSELDHAFFTLKTVVTPPPQSELIVKGAGDSVCIPCKNRVVAAQKVAAFLFANDPQIAVKGGEWVFSIRSTGILKTVEGISYPPQPGVADVVFLARTAPIPATGRLRVHLHFTGSGGLTAATAPTDERLQQGLDDLTAILATAGIAVDVAGYHDVPGAPDDPALTDLSGTLGVPNALSALFLLGQPDDLAALNVFFVNSIFKDDDFGGGIVLGVAGGVPGPAFIGPSYRSGVAITTFDLAGRVDFFGNVLAHEIGHYLGLFHSTERDSVYYDTLADTAEDDPANLMHWAYSPEQLVISPDQATVMRSHPLVLPDE